MNLFRIAGRTMLASYFVVNGAKSITNPQPLVEKAQPLVDKALPLVKDAAPASVAKLIPESTPALIRLNGAMQVAGGLALASGLGRRLGAGMLSLAMLPHVLADNPMQGADAEDRAEKRKNILRNAALLGGVMVVSQDLQGRPSLSWRAEQQKRMLERKGDKTARQLRRDAKNAKKNAQKMTREVTRAAKKRADQVAEILPG